MAAQQFSLDAVQEQVHAAFSKGMESQQQLPRPHQVRPMSGSALSMRWLALHQACACAWYVQVVCRCMLV